MHVDEVTPPERIELVVLPDERESYGPKKKDPNANRIFISARHKEVLELVALGLTNKEIGQKLFISEDTVKTHVRRLMQKTGTGTRVSLVVLAARMGWLEDFDAVKDITVNPRPGAVKVIRIKAKRRISPEQATALAIIAYTTALPTESQQWDKEHTHTRNRWRRIAVAVAQERDVQE